VIFHRCPIAQREKRAVDTDGNKAIPKVLIITLDTKPPYIKIEEIRSDYPDSDNNVPEEAISL
jgi:hypothetical protein